MREGADYIAEGGREDQKFIIELPGMAQERFPKLVEMAGKKLLLPVYELNSNWERDNELLLRNYLCKSYEPKCIIGVPVCDSVDETVIAGVHAYYDNIMLPRIIKMNLLSPRMAEIYINNTYDELTE